MMKKQLLFLLILLGFITEAHSQLTRDAGLWTTLNLEKELPNEFSVSLDEEFRLKENFSMLNLFYTSLGLNYKITDNIKVAVTYRLIEKWKYEKQYFSYRHRLMFDIGYKYKPHKWILAYRSRIQTEYRDINSSDLGKIPEWYWRQKIDIKYKIGKYMPYIGAEFRYQISDPRAPEDNHDWHRVRTFAGLDYEINKKNTFGLYYLIQQEFDIKEPQYLYIVGVQYIIEIKD